MSQLAAFRLTQGFYVLLLGVWAGALIMLAIGAAITFKTVREYEPTLGKPPYNNPALAPDAPGILAGGITGNVLRGLSKLQTVCAIGAAICVLLQCTAFRGFLSNGVGGMANVLRIALIALPIVVLVVDQFVVSPRIWEHRAVMYNPKISQAERDEARAVFQRYHKASERVVGVALLSLIAASLVSPFAFRVSASAEAATGAASPTGKEVARG